MISRIVPMAKLQRERQVLGHNDVCGSKVPFPSERSPERAALNERNFTGWQRLIEVRWDLSGQTRFQEDLGAKRQHRESIKRKTIQQRRRLHQQAIAA